MAPADPAGGVGRPSAAVLAVVALTLAGLVLRLLVAGDALFADELSTYWIVTAHDLPGVVSTVHSTAEITPPLFFVLAWLSSRLGHAPELLRLPSVLAGAATIPVVYALGRRVAGAAAGVVGAGLAALAPFLVYYGAEARGYAVMVACVAVSTLALLIAVEDGGRRGWTVYALGVAGAAYAHYTCFFVLGAQLAWVLVARPAARRPALLATLGAVLLFLPWSSGFVGDLRSPTSAILSALSPLSPGTVRIAVEHWTVGYPYAALHLSDLPGPVGLALIAAGLLVAAAGLAARRASARPGGPLVLAVLLAVATPVGELLVSAVGTNVFGTRNLAASWPALAVVLGALLTAPRGRVGAVASALTLAGFAVGAVLMLEPVNRRPDYVRALDLAVAGPRPVVVDATGILSPGPLTGLDAAERDGVRLVRAGAPAQRDHPFNAFDPVAQAPAAARRAVALARGGPVGSVRYAFTPSTAPADRAAALRDRRLPAPYRIVRRHVLRSHLGSLVAEVSERR